MCNFAEFWAYSQTFFTFLKKIWFMVFTYLLRTSWQNFIHCNQNFAISNTDLAIFLVKINWKCSHQKFTFPARIFITLRFPCAEKVLFFHNQTMSFLKLTCKITFFLVEKHLYFCRYSHTIFIFFKKKLANGILLSINNIQ